MRHAENLNRPEERVQICEPKTGINLNDVEDEMGSAEDLMDCQEGSRKITIFQVGRDKQMRLSEGLINLEVSLNQPEELTKKMSSELDLDQQMQLTEEKDLRNLLMIGGIQIFLPFAQEEAEICIVDIEATIAEAG